MHGAATVLGMGAAEALRAGEGGVRRVGGGLLARLVSLGAGAVPGSWGERFETAARDARWVQKRLAGEGGPPYRAFARSEVRTRAADEAGARTLRVCSVERETSDAVTVWLEDVGGAAIGFVPGQFVTLLLRVEGREVRRAYSICSAKGDLPRVAVTVKRVEGGLASGYLNGVLRAGDEVRALGPSGNFQREARGGHAGHVVLVGGGSGITPLMAIAREVLAHEPGTRVSLLYGNRSAGDVIFAGALGAMQREHGARFEVLHCYEECEEAHGGLRGRLAGDVLAGALESVNAGAESEYFVCGPAAMMASAREVLLGRGVREERIREERFASPKQSEGRASSQSQPVTVRKGGATHLAIARPGQTVLEAGLAAGAPMPYSCAMGGCGACRVKLAKGSVALDEPCALSDRERAEGYVLACVAHPQGPVEVEVG